MLIRNSPCYSREDNSPLNPFRRRKMYTLKCIIGGIGNSILDFNQLETSLRDGYCQPTVTAAEKCVLEAAINSLPELEQKFIPYEDLGVSFQDFYGSELSKFLLPNAHRGGTGNKGGGSSTTSSFGL
jgi:hypothetical protein